MVSGPALGGDQTVSTADYSGQVIVLNVWGSWCPPCRAEAPALQAASQETKDKAQFIGITVRDNAPAQAEAFVRAQGISYPSIFDPTGKVLLPLSAGVAAQRDPVDVDHRQPGPAGRPGAGRGLQDHSGRHDQRCRGRQVDDTGGPRHLGRGRGRRLDGAGPARGLAGRTGVVLLALRGAAAARVSLLRHRSGGGRGRRGLEPPGPDARGCVPVRARVRGDLRDHRGGGRFGRPRCWPNTGC